MTRTCNVVSELLQAGIPVCLGKFSCGCWGKHSPPYLADGEIVVEVGEGYRSGKHLHGQNLYPLEVDATARVALIEVRKYGDLFGAGLWHYLVGMDGGSPFICQVSSQIDHLAEALEALKPAEVLRWEEKHQAAAIRQGDWYFLPCARTPRGNLQPGPRPLDDDHVAEECMTSATQIYVRGEVTHGTHASILLDGWHKAVRNNAIRTGRFSGRNGSD